MSELPSLYAGPDPGKNLSDLNRTLLRKKVRFHSFILIEFVYNDFLRIAMILALDFSCAVRLNYQRGSGMVWSDMNPDQK